MRNEAHGGRVGSRMQLSGMTGFTVMWIGQVVSLLGSAMTNFAIMIWLWQVTGLATPFAIYGFASMAPLIFAGPIAGALVDRWDRKLAMALSDIAAAVTTVAMLILHITGSLQVWHLYVLGAFSGFFGSFQFPAFSAAVTMMVSKQHYARASAMRSMAETASGILAPVLAAMLLGWIGILGVFVVDIVTFGIALSTLLVVHVPRLPVTRERSAGAGSIWRQSLYGFRYLLDRPSLFSLLVVFLVMNITLAYASVLRTPMILARTGGNELTLGTVQSAATAGGLVSSLMVIAWGGPRVRIPGVFMGMAAMSIGLIAMGLGRTVVVWAISGFVTMFFLIIVNSCSQAFWQSKVAPEVQGRVFAARGMLGRAATPLAMITAGPLADRVFEPQVSGGGVLGLAFGWMVGTNPGSGLSLIFVFLGAVALVTAAVGYGIRVVRDAETILPDHEVASTQG